MDSTRLTDTVRETRRTPAGALRYRWTLIGGSLAILAVFAAVGIEWTPLWLGVALVHVIAARLTIQVHEYIHCVTPAQANLFVRVLPVMIGPLSGFREISELHHRHHDHALGREDPDLRLTLDHPVRAYARILFYYEYFFFYYLRSRGRLVPAQALEIGLRVGLFAVAFVFIPWTHVAALALSGRLAFTTSYFLLSWHLHRSGEFAGTYRKHAPPVLGFLIRALGGHAAVETLTFHDVHHLHPGVDVSGLRRVAALIPHEPHAEHRYRAQEMLTQL